MKKFLILAVACSLTFVACKKTESKSQSRSELLVGTWNVNAVGIDANMNGLLETSEYQNIPAGAAIVQTYRADGTGVFTGRQQNKADTSYNITWKLTNSDQNVAIGFPDNSTTNATITELTERRLQAYNPAITPRQVFLLTK